VDSVVPAVFKFVRVVLGRARECRAVLRAVRSRRNFIRGQSCRPSRRGQVGCQPEVAGGLRLVRSRQPHLHEVRVADCHPDARSVASDEPVADVAHGHGGSRRQGFPRRRVDFLEVP
jgi:hypothetical protein